MPHEGEIVEGPVLDRRRLPATRKPVSHVLALSMFTDEQMLETHLKTATPCHFSARPVRLHRSKTVIARRWRVMGSDMSHKWTRRSRDPVS
jgi:hypothetical protein